MKANKIESIESIHLYPLNEHIKLYQVEIKNQLLRNREGLNTYL